jgi:hypothetical protein
MYSPKLALVLAVVLLRCFTFVAAQSGTLNGRLSTSDGSSVEGIRVSAIFADDGKGRIAGTTQTDSQGRYVIGNITPGRYYVYAGTSEFPIYFPGVTSNAAARPVVVGGGVTSVSVDFAVHRIGVSVSGKLIMSNSEGLYTITLKGNGSTREMSPIGAREFEFRGVMPGTYTISTSPDLKLQPLTVTVKLEDIGGLVLSPPTLKLYHVRGKITQGYPDQPVSRLPEQVMLLGSQNSVFTPPAKVQPDGSFDFETVAPGHYKVTASLTSPEKEIDVKDSDISGINIPVYPRIPMTVRISMDDGTPMPAFDRLQLMRLEVVPEFTSEYRTALDPNTPREDFITPGNAYVFLGTPPGYFLTSMKSGNFDLFRSQLVVAPDADHVTVEATIGRKPASVSTIVIRGRLTGGQIGIPIVLSATSNLSTRAPDFSTFTARNGAFEFTNVVPGRYNLGVAASGSEKSNIIAVGKDLSGLDIDVPAGNVINVMFMGIANQRSPGFPDHMTVRFQNGEENRSIELSAGHYSRTFALPVGKYTISVEGLAAGFFVKTMSAGGIDLLSSPLDIPNNPRTIPVIQFLVDYKAPSP